MPRGVVILPSYYEAILPLPEEDRLKMYDAILAYGFNGEIIELPPRLIGLFALIRPTIDTSRRRYDASVANGKKGGRPSKNQTQNQTENQTQNHDIDIEKDIDIEFDRETETEKEGAGGENPCGFSAAVLRTGEEFEELRQAALKRLKE